MDAFYASVEQRDDAALRGKPVVVAWRGARSVVCAASYEARRFGIHSAMAAVRAERLCPQAVFVAPDFTRYKAVSRQVREIFARYTERIEPLSLDEAYLDVTVPRIALPSATAIAQAIRTAIRRETRLIASAGVAPNKYLAKIASDLNKPRGMALIGIAARRDPQTNVEMLILRLDDKKASVRARACRAVAACVAREHFSIARVADKVSHLMVYDKKSRVRLEAIRALAAIGAPADIPRLEGALTHEYPVAVRFVCDSPMFRWFPAILTGASNG